MDISGGYLLGRDLFHYVVITKNYDIDIICEFEPDVILYKNKH